MPLPSCCNSKSTTEKALKILVKTLKNSRKNEFYCYLHYWYLTYQDYLNERSDKCNEKGYFPYKHKGLRSALSSLKYDKNIYLPSKSTLN
ncbi:hypothetical protein ACWIUH_09665 [Ursidibacter arcticus]